MNSTTNVRRVVLTIIGVLLAVAVASGDIGIQLAASKTAPAAPTITSKPTNPAASTTATFTFTGPSGATFQCQLDSAPTFASCPSGKTYSGLSQGSHTFQVKAVVGFDQSTATSYTWTVDTVLPPAPSITAKPVSLSNTTSPAFSFTDTEIGVTFRCQLDGPTWTACSSPRSYSGLTQGAQSFAVQAVDAAGNNSGSATWVWSIDSIAPAAPVLTTKPTDPTFNATNIFAWTAESGSTFQCSVENGAWFACPTPYTYVIVTSNFGQHQFAVRAIDAAGNISAGTSYSFKYEKKLPNSGMPFQITGSVGGLTLGTYKPILVTITNPNSVTIFVSALNVAVAADSTPTGCTSLANVDLVQSNVSKTLTVAVPANGSVSLPAQGAVAPKIRLKNLSDVNQDVCKGKSFTLTYSGTATN
jgi:hypothetical protein